MADENKKPVTASLYGGINYDTSTEEMQNQSRGYNCSFSRGVFERDTSNKERGSWGFLPGSQQEVTDVSTQLTTADITNKQLPHYNDFHYRNGVNGGIADALPGTCNPAVISPPRHSYTTKATGYAFSSIARNIIL